LTPIITLFYPLLGGLFLVKLKFIVLAVAHIGFGHHDVMGFLHEVLLGLLGLAHHRVIPQVEGLGGTELDCH
jgi:hypothetical protein